MRRLLRNGKWEEVLKLALTQYQPGLPAWIVYIDERGGVRQCVVADSVYGSQLRNKRFVWAMVFAERPMQAAASLTAASHIRLAGLEAESVAKSIAAGMWDSAARVSLTRIADTREASIANPSDAALRDRADKAALDAADAATKSGAASAALLAARTELTRAEIDTVDLRFTRRTVAVPPDPVIINLIKTFAKGFGLEVGASAPTVIDSTRTIWLRPIGADTARTLFGGFARLGLIENAQVQLSLSPPPNKWFAYAPTDSAQRLESVYANVANLKKRSFELGVLAGVVTGGSVPTYDANLRLTEGRTNTTFGTYVTIVVNLPKPLEMRGFWWKEPWQRSPVGGFVGTNILPGTPGEQLIVGGTIGHLVGSAGLSIGAAWVPTQQPRGGVLTTVKHRRLIFGLDLRL
ncbi:MAG: hypothetical protein WD801_03690 [Gemmatimonadaceae bacterium]